MNRTRRELSSSTVHLKVGRVFEATGTGWGVVIIPVALLLVAAAALWLRGG